MALFSNLKPHKGCLDLLKVFSKLIVDQKVPKDFYLVIVGKGLEDVTNPQIEKILADFALTVQREQTKIQLDDQNDALKKLEKQQRNLEKDNQGLHDDIENWKKRITKAEADIETNLKNQEDAKVKIEAQKKLVEEVQKKLNSMN